MTTRDRLVVIVLVAAALLGGFWFMLLAPKRKEASDVRGKVIAQEQKLAKARGAVAAAQEAKARYNADYAAVAALGQAVPADDDVPSLIVQVDRAAEREGVSFRSLALDASGTAQQPSAPTPAPAPAPSSSAPATGEEKKGGSDSGSAAAPPAAPAAPTQAAASALPPGASVGPAGFPTMPFTFEFTGSFFRLEDFLDRLNDFTRVQSDGDIAVRGRLLSVDTFDLKAAPSGFPRIAASVHATSFVLPPGQGLTAGATPSGPAGSDSGSAPAPAAPADSGSTAKPTAALMLTGGRR